MHTTAQRTHNIQADEMVRTCTAAEAAAQADTQRPSHRPIPLDTSALRDQLDHVQAQHARLQAHQRNLAEQLAALPPLYTELQDIPDAMVRDGARQCSSKANLNRMLATPFTRRMCLKTGCALTPVCDLCSVHATVGACFHTHPTDTLLNTECLITLLHREALEAASLNPCLARMFAQLVDDPTPSPAWLDALDHALAVLECHPDFPGDQHMQLGVQLAIADLLLARWGARVGAPSAPPPGAEDAVAAATECLPTALHAAGDVVQWIEAYAHYCSLDSHHRAALDDQWRRAEQPRLLDELDSRQLRRSRLTPRGWGVRGSAPGSPPDNPRRRRDSVFLPSSSREGGGDVAAGVQQEPLQTRARRALVHMTWAREEVCEEVCEQWLLREWLCCWRLHAPCQTVLKPRHRTYHSHGMRCEAVLPCTHRSMMERLLPQTRPLQAELNCPRGHQLAV